VFVCDTRASVELRGAVLPTHFPIDEVDHRSNSSSIPQLASLRLDWVPADTQTAN